MVKKERAAARKVKDKWKAKTWYTLHAPEMFNRVALGETPAEEAEKLLGRVTEVTVQDITGDFSKMHIKLMFQADDIKGTEVNTHFVGHDMTSDYIRRLTRRKRSRVDGVIDVTAKDGARLRVKPMAITDRRIQSSKQSAIRSAMYQVVSDMASRATLGDLVKAIISGEMAKNISTACKPVQPVFKVEVRRSEVVQPGRPVEATTAAPVAAPTAAEAVPAEAAPSEATAEGGETLGVVPEELSEESEEIPREEESEEIPPEEEQGEEPESEEDREG